MKKTTEFVPFQPTFSILKDRVGEIRDLVNVQMQGAAILLMQNLFKEEVERLCGRPFSRKSDGENHRGGNDPGSVKLQGQRIAVTKPRVKSEGREVQLESYQAFQDFDLLCDKVMKHMINGVSTRNYDPLLDQISKSTGLKKSSVSKAFVQGSQEALDELNGRDLSPFHFFSIMIDGVEFAGKTVIVAMGITDKGKKLILGLKAGSTENSEVVKDLLQNLISRGLNKENPILFVLDGSKALKKAVLNVFGDCCPVQRCVRHKERNICQYLPKQYHQEFRRRWKLIHGSNNFDTAEAEMAILEHWLGQINHEALNSLEEAERETLTVIKLRASRELRKSILSTNPIESMMDGIRTRTNRVKNWKSGPDQIQRWVATSLLEIEKKLRAVRGCESIKIVMANMMKKDLQNQVEVA